MTTALGNGAPFLLSPNLIRPFTKRISHAFSKIYSCQYVVSVLAGIKQTTTVPFNDSSNAFLTHFFISLPYGGFINVVFFHSCDSLSFSIVKNLYDLAISFVWHRFN